MPSLTAENRKNNKGVKATSVIFKNDRFLSLSHPYLSMSYLFFLVLVAGVKFTLDGMLRQRCLRRIKYEVVVSRFIRVSHGHPTLSFK